MREPLSLTVLLCCFLQVASHAQTIQNVRVNFEGGGIAVYYDLVSDDPEKTYDFYLYGSHDNYQSPLQQVKGDVGQNLSPGTNKSIQWDARKEFGNFKGDINLKIKGGVHTPLLTFEDFTAGKKIKKSKPLNITWSSTSNISELTLEILKEGEETGYIQSIENTGQYMWIVPKDFKKGKDYQVRISDKNNPLKHEISKKFNVKGKTPVLVMVAPVVLAGGAYLFLSGGSDKPSGPGSGTSEGIPDPPANP